jgi:hypothetical protein
MRVVTTITDDERDRLLASGGPEGHVARRLLARATVVPVAATLSPAEDAAARRAFPGRDFADGMGGAFRGAWQSPRFRLPDAEPAKQRRRPDFWLFAALAGTAAAAALIVAMHFDRGLRAPAPMDRQIAALKLDLGACGLETFAGDEDNLPIVATVDAGRECEGHASGADPVLVYDVRNDRLRPVYDFGPPGEGFPQDARFGCRGGGSNPCWTDVTGAGDHVILGVFRDPGTQALLPVVVWRDVSRGWRVDPLLTKPSELPRQYEADIYTEPVDVGGGREGYRVADVAVLPPREGERSLPARAVVGFAPHSALLSPRRLETQARPLSFERGVGVGVQDTCLVVRDGVPRPRLDSLVGGRALSEALRKRWETLEKAREGICVLSR